QVVPRIEGAAAGDLAAGAGDDTTEERMLHILSRERVRIPRGRVVTGSVEPVGNDVVRVLETELRRALVHHPDERLHGAADVGRERVRSIVGALDERRREKIADLQALAGLQVDRGLADRG